MSGLCKASVLDWLSCALGNCLAWSYKYVAGSAAAKKPFIPLLSQTSLSKPAAASIHCLDAWDLPIRKKNTMEDLTCPRIHLHHFLSLALLSLPTLRSSAVQSCQRLLHVCCGQGWNSSQITHPHSSQKWLQYGATSTLETLNRYRIIFLDYLIRTSLSIPLVRCSITSSSTKQESDFSWPWYHSCHRYLSTANNNNRNTLKPRYQSTHTKKFIFKLFISKPPERTHVCVHHIHIHTYRSHIRRRRWRRRNSRAQEQMCLKKHHQTLGTHLLQFIFFFSSPICEERNPQKCVLQKVECHRLPRPLPAPTKTCFDSMTSWIWFATRSNPAARLLIIPNSYYRLQNVSSHHNIIVSTIPNISFFFSFFFPACCSPFVQGERQNPNKNYYPLLYKPVSQRSFQKVGWKPNQKSFRFCFTKPAVLSPPFFPPFLSACQPARERSVISSFAAEFHKNLQPPSSCACPLPGRRFFSASPSSELLLSRAKDALGPLCHNGPFQFRTQKNRIRRMETDSPNWNRN